MKRYIYSTTEQGPVELRDSIVVDFYIDLPKVIESATSYNSVFSYFPGVEQLRIDIAEMLQDEYQFEVLTETANGKEQQGHCSNREDSISLYFNTFYNLNNAEPIFKKLGISSFTIPQDGIVKCFIHLRISDHPLNDYSDVEHREYVKKVVNENASDLPRENIFPDEDIRLNQSLIYRYYEQALEELRDDIELRIVGWCKAVTRNRNLK